MSTTTTCNGVATAEHVPAWSICKPYWQIAITSDSGDRIVIGEERLKVLLAHIDMAKGAAGDGDESCIYCGG